MNTNVQGNPRPSPSIPDRFLGHPFNLLVIHNSDLHRIEMARLSLRALSDLVADDTPTNCRVSLDRVQLAFLLDIIADKLDDIPEVAFIHVVQHRAQIYQPSQGA